MNPKVSIIIPTYKRSDHVVRAVSSALLQDYSNLEVIVIDDNDPNSIDRIKTRENLNQFSVNKNFKYIEHKKNQNGAVARNTGIKHSSGDYITFLDDDDEYYINKVSEQVKCLEELDESWGLCYTGYDKVEKNGRISTSAEKSEGNVLVQALSKNLFVGSGSNFMIRKNVVLEMNGFDETFMRNQDLEFLVRVVFKYKMKLIDKSLFLIHIDKTNNRFNYSDIVDVYNRYRVTFKNFIDNLSKKDKLKVEKVLDLSDIRLAITYLKFFEAIKLYKSSKLNILDLIKYFKYIIKRIITNKSYGFRL